MTVVLWIIAALLAIVFAGAGAMKLSRSKAQLAANPQMAWTEDFAPELIKAIGALEVLGAIGLILPPIVSVATVLTPLAAVGLALIMVGAIITHSRRGERQPLGMNAVLLILAVVVAWGRFGPYSF